MPVDVPGRKSVDGRAEQLVQVYRFLLREIETAGGQNHRTGPITTPRTNRTAAAKPNSSNK